MCTAGGWTGGSAASAELVDAVAQMQAVCVQPALASAHLACTGSLGEGGTLILTGAAAALGPTPTMLAYGMAKAATHHLAASVAAPGGGLPSGARALCVLPRVLDTPSNRKWMAGPGVDTTAWTPPAHLAAQFLAWCEGGGAEGGAVPPSGSLVTADTAGGITSFALARAPAPV